MTENVAPLDTIYLLTDGIFQPNIMQTTMSPYLCKYAVLLDHNDMPCFMNESALNFPEGSRRVDMHFCSKEKARPEELQ